MTRRKGRWRPRRSGRGIWGSSFMKDFLRGTGGRILEIALLFAGISLTVRGCEAASEQAAYAWVIAGIVCFCASAGVSYALGTIHRLRF